MQKRAHDYNNRYETRFDPIPAKNDTALYFDKTAVDLPYGDFTLVHYHDRYEIGLCESGDGLFLASGEFFSVSANDIIFIPPGCHHYSRSLHKNIPCKCRFVYIPRLTVDRILRMDQVDGDAASTYAYVIPSVLHNGEHAYVSDTFRRIIEICVEDTPNAQRLAPLKLATLIFEAYELFGARKSDPNTLPKYSKTSYVEAVRIAEYLSLHYEEAATASELAALCHLSESQLRRQFIAAYGMPPIAYRNHLRCRIAAELLSHSGLSVADISSRVGYSVPSDFYRAFLKMYKMSPLEYRKANK